MLCKSSHENVSPKPSTLYCMEMMKLSISLIQLHKNSHHFSKVITIFSVFLLSFISIIQISFWCIISNFHHDQFFKPKNQPKLDPLSVHNFSIQYLKGFQTPHVFDALIFYALKSFFPKAFPF